MDYYHQKYLDRPVNFQMSADKLAKKPNIPHCKESMEGFEYTSLFSSKTYSILSYIVGGFVGSKSQMNNNKHNLSYDLSAAIFNLLNPCKYEREKASVKKGNENNFYSTASKINPDCYEKYIVGRSSQKGEKMKDCILDVMEMEWLGSVPLLDHSNYVFNFNEQCYDPKRNTEENFSDTYNCDTKKSPDINNVVVIENISCDKVENIVLESVSETGGTEFLITSENNLNSSVDVTDSENSNMIMVDVLEIPDIGCDTPIRENSKLEINYLSPVQRFRQYSECSVESTDSESFIVFDDPDQDEGCCLNNQNDYDSEDGNGEEDDSSCDDYDFDSVDKELADANHKWLRNYKDVAAEEDEGQRKVRFNDAVKVNKIVAWDFAYRAARPGPWEQMARDRVRFRERIIRLSSTISPILGKEHRDKIYKELYS